MPVPPARRRVIERRVAAGAIGLAALVAMSSLAWRFVFPDAWWSLELPPAVGSGWEVFNLYLWLKPILIAIAWMMAAAVVVRTLLRRRRPAAWIAAALPVVVCLGAAALHAPFYGMTTGIVDRVAGTVQRPVLVARAVAVSGMVTFTLAALFLGVVCLRHTPAAVRQAARTVAATLAGVVLVLFWLQMVLPMSDGWFPAHYHQPELLMPFRPCRGALLWQMSRDRYDGSLHAHHFARIDDVWLHFADPRTNGAPVWAVSATGEWERGYYWLTRDEAATLRVRRDDPAVVRCDSRVRPEAVAPASWHRLGPE
jgi:hypothetical protein